MSPWYTPWCTRRWWEAPVGTWEEHHQMETKMGTGMGRGGPLPSRARTEQEVVEEAEEVALVPARSEIRLRRCRHCRSARTARTEAEAAGTRPSEARPRTGAGPYRPPAGPRPGTTASCRRGGPRRPGHTEPPCPAGRLRIHPSRRHAPHPAGGRRASAKATAVTTTAPLGCSPGCSRLPGTDRVGAPASWGVQLSSSRASRRCPGGVRQPRPLGRGWANRSE
eukprot:1009620-Prorocentrum_minimum.AAC.1